ncbi:MAG: RAD55 family ATPase, partial [Nocardioidaceae bacterium]
SSGIQALDEMLKDGYWSGASTLVAGPTGIGKTLMGLHFVFHAVADGERAIIATTQEDPSQLERVARQFGWDVSSDRLTVMYRSPVDLDVDQCVHALLDMIEATGASRVLVDSLGDLQAAAADDARFREYLYSLLHRSSRRGTSVMLTYEVSELTGVNRLSDAAMSQLADNVVLLEYGQLGEAMTRYLTVLKTRAADHQSGSREFRITDDGLLLAPTLGSSSATE